MHQPTHSPDCVLGWAAASESWVLHGLSHPGRLRDCSPRHRSLVSGRPRGDSCAEGGKSILLAVAPSESWKSAQRGREKSHTDRQRQTHTQKLRSLGVYQRAKPKPSSHCAQKQLFLQTANTPRAKRVPSGLQSDPPPPSTFSIPPALLTGPACDQAADAYRAARDVTRPCNITTSSLTG